MRFSLYNIKYIHRGFQRQIIIMVQINTALMID